MQLPLRNTPTLNRAIWDKYEPKAKGSRPPLLTPEQEIFEDREPDFFEQQVSQVRHGKAATEQFTMKLQRFAPAYVANVKQKLGPEQSESLKLRLSTKTDKLASLAILQATAVCCELLGPGAAVALARETAQELVPQNSIQENHIEQKIVPEFVPFTDDLVVAKVEKPTPAAASTQKVVLTPWFVKTASKEAGLVAIGHEISHLRHRDIIGNFGDATLKCALTVAGNATLNSSNWSLADKTLLDINLASAKASRDREYRCDDEAVSSMLGLGLSKETILQGFSEVFVDKKTEVDLLSEHPPAPLRLDAVKAKLSLV